MIPLALIVWQAVVVICLAVDSLAVPAVIGLLHIVALFAHVLFPHLPFAVAPSFQLAWVCHAVVLCGIATGTVLPLMVGASFLGSIAASFSSIGIALSLLELFQRKGLCVPLTASVPARTKRSKKAAAKSTAKKDAKSTAAAWGGGGGDIGDDDDLPQSHSPGGLLSLHRKFCVFYAIVALVLAVAVEILLCAEVVAPNHSDVFSPILLTVIGNLNTLAHILILAAIGVSHHHEQRSLLDRELEVVSGVLHHCAKQQVREAVTAVNEWPLGISTAMVEPLTDIVRSMQQDDPEVMGMTLTLPVGGEGDPLSDGSVSQTDGVAVVAVYLPPSIVSNVVMLLSATQGVASIAASHNGHLCFNEPVGNEAYLVMLWAPQKSRSVSDCIAAADRAARAIVRALGTNEKLRDKTGCSLVCGRVVQQRSGTRPKTTGPAVARAQAYALYGSMVNQPFLLDRISAHHATFLTTPLEALAIPCSDRPLEVLFKPTIPTDGRLQQLGGDDPVRRWMGEVQADDTGVERIMDAVLAIEDGDIGTALKLLGEHCQQFKSDDKGLMWLDRIRRDEGVVPRVISYTLSNHSTISSQLNSQQNGATVQFGGGSISQGHVTSGPLSHGEFSDPSPGADVGDEPAAAKSIRESFLASTHSSPSPPSSSKRAPVNAINNRLARIIEDNKAHQRQQRAAKNAQNGGGSLDYSSGIHGGADGSGGPHGGGGYDEEDVLTQEEIDTLRVAEFDAKVLVYVQLPKMIDPRFAAPGTAASNNVTGQLSLIGEDALVKIYPKHVVLTKSSGAPLVEFVIEELVGINEDETRHALTFELKKSDGTTTVIEIICSNIPARSAIYKIVCRKRSQVESA